MWNYTVNRAGETGERSSEKGDSVKREQDGQNGLSMAKGRLKHKNRFSDDLFDNRDIQAGR